MGGWGKVCRDIPEDFLRREFVKTYAALRGTIGSVPMCLPGDNSKSEFGFPEEVVFIGRDCKVQAKKITFEKLKRLEVGREENSLEVVVSTGLKAFPVEGSKEARSEGKVDSPTDQEGLQGDAGEEGRD
jgi:hypothetical protein